jgi:hypothetical protein
MKDHYQIARSPVEFNEYVPLTSYNEHGLYTRNYKALTPCLKDAVAFSGKRTPKIFEL